MDALVQKAMSYVTVRAKNRHRGNRYITSRCHGVGWSRMYALVQKAMSYATVRATNRHRGNRYITRR